MSISAQVVKLEERRPVVKADIENGYDRLAHAITDALAMDIAKLSPAESRVIHAVIAKTYRFHKKQDWITNSQIIELTRLEKSQVSKARKRLIEKGVLFEDGREIGINPIVSEWGIVKNSELSKSTTKVVKSDNTQSCQNRQPQLSKLTTRVVETDNKSCQNRQTQKKETITKETYTKESGVSKSAKSKHEKIKNLELPTCIPKNSWCEFVDHRIHKKDPLSELAASKAISKLEEYAKQGFCIKNLIDAIIINGWKGIWLPNGMKPTKRVENFRSKDYGQSDFDLNKMMGVSHD